MGDRARRAARPGVERVESREMLAAGLAGAAGWRAHAAAARAVGAVQVPADASAQANALPTTDRFRGVFSGPHHTSTLPGTGGGTVYTFRGLGGTNLFLHGDYTMGVTAPADTTKPFSGESVLQDKNTSSQAILHVTLVGNRADVDSRGRPTRLTFSVDPTAGSGIFVNGRGEGTVEIRYGRNVATVVFAGRVIPDRLANPLANSDLYEKAQPIVPLAPPPLGCGWVFRTAARLEAL